MITYIKVNKEGTMKKYIFVLLFVLIAAFAHSQEQGTMDFNVSAGILSSNFFIDFTADVLTGVFTFGQSNFKTRYIPVLNAAFKYAVMNNWFVNAGFTYEYAKKQLLDNNGGVLDNQIHNYYNFAIGTEYHYINSDIIQIYSGAAIAYTLHMYESNKGPNNLSYVNFQLDAFGLRIGKSLAGFLELGFGYKGILILGISYQH